jgi:hypothetical protein
MGLWRINCYLIIPHPAEPRVLLLAGEAGWALPSLSIEVDGWHEELRLLRQAVREQFGVDATVLCSIVVRSDEAANQADTIYMLENHSPDWAPAVGQWFDRRQLAQLTVALPEQRAAVEERLAQAAGAPLPEQRMPWARPGWFMRAAAWMQQQLAGQGYFLEGPVEQIRSVSISCVLRARTNRGDIYFKAAAALPLFGDEPALTQALAERFPSLVPTILATEPAQRWMLMSDFGQPLSKSRDRAVWVEALRQFAPIQIACAAQVDQWLAKGCLDRRLDRLAEQIDVLLADEQALSELQPAEREQLHGFGPRIGRMCEQLASYAAPQTLVHGDLHLGNIALQGDQYTFFDWTDACIAHPFLDLITVLNHADEIEGALEETQALLCDAYLAGWLGYEPLERLREACALALPLGALHQAVSYQHILAGVEPAARAEWDGAIGYWLRKALKLAPEDRDSRL